LHDSIHTKIYRFYLSSWHLKILVTRLASHQEFQISASSFTINPAPGLASKAMIEALSHVVTPHLSDNLHRLCGVQGLQKFHKGKKLVGTAMTVKARPGDNLLVYKALMMMQPGHVLVVDGAGDPTNALVGELIMLYAIQRGCAGFVIDGAIRDSAAFYQADFPCHARSVSHRGPYKMGPGAVNVPVTIGGQVIAPGDVIVADEDGIVCFPQIEADGLLLAAQASARKEELVKAEIASGHPSQSWLNNMLAPYGLAN
jgi:RraA family protein